MVQYLGVPIQIQNIWSGVKYVRGWWYMRSCAVQLCIGNNGSNLTKCPQQRYSHFIRYLVVQIHCSQDKWSHRYTTSSNHKDWYQPVTQTSKVLYRLFYFTAMPYHGASLMSPIWQMWSKWSKWGLRTPRWKTWGGHSGALWRWKHLIIFFSYYTGSVISVEIHSRCRSSNAM